VLAGPEIDKENLTQRNFNLRAVFWARFLKILVLRIQNSKSSLFKKLKKQSANKLVYFHFEIP
jgi:hypothetical protein